MSSEVMWKTSPMAHRRVASTVIGVSDPARIERIAALAALAIPEPLWAELDALAPPPELWLN